MKLPKIVSNNPKETLLIFAFILLLLFVLLMRRVYAAEVVVRPGMAFGTGGLAPVLGLDGRFPQGNNFALVAGTTLWGETSRTETNWDWHGGIVTCRGSFCASLEAVYLQGEDYINGSHAEFALGLSYRFHWMRVEGVELLHLSNAGTQMPNRGRNAVLLPIRLQ